MSHLFGGRGADTDTMPAVAVSDRGLLRFAVVWQGFALVDIMVRRGPTAGSGSWVVALGLLACALTWWWAWWRPSRNATIANLGALTTVALLLLGPYGSVGDGWAIGRYLVHVAVVVAGLLLPLRTALAYSASLLVGETVLLLRLSDVTGGPGAYGVVVWPLYGVAIALTSAFSARALRNAARTVDRQHAALRAEEEVAHAAVAEAREVERLERVLHDTVLNTLTAVSRGGLEGHEDQVRRRAAEAAGIIRGLLGRTPAPTDRPSGSLGDRCAAELTALRGSGATVTVSDHELADLPPDVADAVVAATGEALRNALRHARSSNVSVVASVDRDVDGDAVTVRIEDDGVGFDTGRTPPRFGLTRSVRGVMAAVGGRADVTSTPGVGTTVLLHWSPRDSVAVAPREVAGTPQLGGAVADAVAAVVPAMLLPFFVLDLVWLALYRSRMDVPAATAASVVVYATVVGYALLRASRWSPRHGPLSWPEVAGLCLATTAMALLATVGLGRPDFVDSVTGEAVLSIMWVVTALGPPWAFLAALAVHVVAQGGSVVQLVRPASILILAAALFAHTLRRETRRYDAAVLAEADSRAGQALAESVARRLRDRYRPLEGGALHLLDGLADGRLRPGDAGVRRTAQVEERYARSLVAIDPDAGPAHRLALRLAAAARARALVLDAEVIGDIDGEVDQTRLDEVAAALDHVLSGLPAGTTRPRLTIGPEDGELVARMVADLPSEPGGAAVPGVRFDALPGEGLWEVAIRYG